MHMYQHHSMVMLQQLIGELKQDKTITKIDLSGDQYTTDAVLHALLQNKVYIYISM